MAMDNVTITGQHLLSSEDITTDVYTVFGSENITDSDQPLLRNFQYLNISVRLMIGLLAISGNLLTVVAIGHYENLRSCTNYLIAALAIGDMLGGFNCVIVMINYLTPMTDEIWLNMCAVEFHLNQIASGLNLSYILWISVDRFIFINYPLRYPSLVTPRLTVGAIVLPPVIISIHFMAVYFTLEEYVKMTGRICRGIYPKLWSFSFDMWFYVCTPCIVLLHTSIALIAYRQRRAIDQAQNCSATQGWKITKMLSLVLGVYFACYVPQMTVLSIRKYIAPDYFVFIERACSWIWWTNCWANPFIYAWKNKNFNRAFRSLLQLRNPTVYPVMN